MIAAIHLSIDFELEIGIPRSRVSLKVNRPQYIVEIRFGYKSVNAANSCQCIQLLILFDIITLIVQKCKEQHCVWTSTSSLGNACAVSRSS